MGPHVRLVVAGLSGRVSGTPQLAAATARLVRDEAAGRVGPNDKGMGRKDGPSARREGRPRGEGLDQSRSVESVNESGAKMEGKGDETRKEYQGIEHGRVDTKVSLDQWSGCMDCLEIQE